MSARLAVGAACLALAVAGLALFRAARVETAAAPRADPAAAVALPVVLDFGRGECAACKRMKPVLDALAARHEGRVVVGIHDLKDESSRALAATHKVTLIPTQVFLDADGNERFRHEGFIPLEELEAELARLGWTR